MNQYPTLAASLQLAGYGPSYSAVLAYFLANEQGTQWDITQRTDQVKPAVLEATRLLIQKKVLTSRKVKTPDGERMVYMRIVPLEDLAKQVFQDFDARQEQLQEAQRFVQGFLSR